MAYRIGVDIGGTFTDFCVFNDSTNELYTLKVLSTPSTPGSEVIEGIRLIKERFAVDPSQVSYFTHGQTVGINTVIQRKGAKLGLLTTENFCDVLELERLRLADVFSLFAARPEPLIPRNRVLPIKERTLNDGTISTPIEIESISRAVKKANSQGVEGIIVSFINSYRNPEHELKAKEIIRREAPQLFSFGSTEVWPIVREYERTVTATINGYVHPQVSNYISALQKALLQQGIPVLPLITKSNGGVMSAERGKTSCVHILLSGTASGVMGASFIGNLCAEKNLFSMDVGGTSADVAIIREGMAQYGTEERVGDFKLFIPSVSVSSIGNGGGSIAWVDPHGVLKVGPESTGSDPGPACYGRGGKRATLTDAFVVCGWIGQIPLAYNSIPVHLDRAKEAILALAGQLNKDPLETAEAVIQVAVSGMFMELSKLIAKYGVDPREFALLAFGGAGPMIACSIARELGIRKILIPPSPGVLSALGGLVADVKNDFIRTVYLELNPGMLGQLREGFGELKHEAHRWLSEEYHLTGQPLLHFSGDMRYHGQSFEIEVPLEESWIESGDIEKMARAFHDQHEQIYGYCDRKAPVQFINIRLVISGPSPKPALAKIPDAKGPLKPVAVNKVYYDSCQHTVPFYQRAELGAGRTFEGPAVILQDDCTTCVLDRFRGFVDPLGIIHLEHLG